MFEFPSSTNVNRTFKIKELLTLMGADKAIKQESQNIDNVTMVNAISEQTTSLKPSSEVNEIYVIKIILKTAKIPYEFIKGLDKSIRFQVLYEVWFDNKVKYLIYYKGLGEKVSQYRLFETEWQDKKLEQINFIKDLTELYKLIISKIAKFQFREDEKLKDWLTRLNEVENLEKEFNKIQKQIKSEIQPKKQFELNSKLREIYKKIEKRK